MQDAALVFSLVTFASWSWAGAMTGGSGFKALVAESEFLARTQKKYI
jgi:hypothetical protein